MNMSTNYRTVQLAALAIALALAGCRVDTQSAATPASTKSATPAKVGPLSAARRDALQRYDRNGNGELDVAERERMESERKARVEALKARINARYDRNGNGMLEADEVQSLRADRDKLSVFKGAALRRYDTNHNGVLDPDERQRMLSERQVFLRDVRGKLMARFDTNRDGTLDRQERAAMDLQLAPGTAPAK
jgi:Ca2+-binding EF-hand superfamily protein